MEGQSPLTEQEILDIYFLENRARLLDIASFLDRLDRARDAGGTPSDFRHEAFIRAVELLLEPGGKRTRDIQMSFSDHTHQPIASAVGLKAVGAWDGGEP
jgi:hypothetical protein